MCGICGIIDYNTSPISEASLRAMTDALSHRGPDDSGTYIDNSAAPHAALGHRRLSIIDLSPHGHQPMPNEDKKIWIVLNGEIYNYEALREELKAKGHLFSSNTDTETVLHLYEELGEDCVNRLNGMFAFAIWDDRKKELFMARDRFGKKPLLYHYKNNTFSFSSEFASLLAGGLVPKEVNREAINYYLSFGYIPAPLTIYRDVFKLPPAHILILKGGNITVKRYWKLDYSKKIDIPEEDAAEEVTRLLKEAVKARLRSDVPLGAFLSGGVDSSITVALMSEVSGRRVKTFCIGFDDERYDETKYARIIAKKFNTEHSEFIVRPNALEILPLLVERYGEPYADSSCIPSYYVAREAKKHVTVVLNGDGGDEMFAGYERYEAMLISERYNALPPFIRSAIKRIISSLPSKRNERGFVRKVKRFSSALELPAAKRYLRWQSIFFDDMKESLYSKDFENSLHGKESADWLTPYIKTSKEIGMLDGILSADVNMYLPNDLLVKMDIVSMANSLEARSPFLDYRVAEFAASLPESYKIKNGVKKYILKKSMSPLVPRENLHRRKMGFGVPVGSWFRGEMKDFLRDNLLSSKSLGRGYFNPAAIKSIVALHEGFREDFSFQLWALLMLELWHKRFIDT